MMRLNPDTLELLPDSVLKPRYDRARLQTGIVHLGLGAFHRAHQAYYTETLLNQGNDSDLKWGIVGCSLRSSKVRDQMKQQDNLYTLVEIDDKGGAYQIIGCIQSVIAATDQQEALLTMLSNPEVRIVSLTITEKGYCHDPATGTLNRSHPDVIHDIDNLDSPITALGYLVKALQIRQRAGHPGFTLLSCDNLPGNGRVLRNVLLEFATAAAPETVIWIEANTRYPCTMIDRIVPATTEADIDKGQSVMGLRDEALVTTEPFTQWIIEDDFNRGRPEWDKAGAQFVSNVDAYEIIKLRLLNGAHSLLAYTGYLSGYQTVADVMRDPAFRTMVRQFMDKEVSPTITVPEGFDLEAYKDQLIERFSNSALQHRTWQIAMDGSQKIPQRWLNTLRYQLKHGGQVSLLCLGMAAWIRYMTDVDDSGATIDVADPWSDVILGVGKDSLGLEDLVDRVLAIEAIFSNDLQHNTELKSKIVHYLQLFEDQGVGITIRTHPV